MSSTPGPRFARVFHVSGQVLVETDLVGDAIAPAAFFNACDSVARIADHVGPQIAANHGGRTAFDDAKESSYDAPEPLLGLYL
jgi:hypothetical protein